jgi:hypothetical protein
LLSFVLRVGTVSADVWALLIAISCAFFFLAERSHKDFRLPRLHPTKTVFLYYGVFFVTPYVTWRLFVDTGAVPQPIGAAYWEWDFSLRMFFVGAWSLWAGSRIFARVACPAHGPQVRRGSQRSPLLAESPGLLLCLSTVCTAVGVGAHLYIFARLGTVPVMSSQVDDLRIQGAAVTPLITQMGFLAVPGFLTAFAGIIHEPRMGLRNPASWLLVACMAAAGTAMALFSARFPLVVSAVAALLIAADRYDWLGPKRILFALVCALAFVLLFGFGRFLLAGEVTAEPTGFLESVVIDLFQPARTFALIPRIFPSELAYRHGITYLQAVVGFVPGAVADSLRLPKKDIWGAGGVFLKEYYGFRFQGGGLGIGALGEGYMNFGPVGVPFAMLVYALLLRLLERGFIRNPSAALRRMTLHIVFASVVVFFFQTEFGLLALPTFCMILPVVVSDLFTQGLRRSGATTVATKRGPAVPPH